MKLLIVENAEHYKVISNLYILFSQRYKTKVLLKKKYCKYVSNIPRRNFINFILPNVFVFWIVIFKAPFYNRIIISSGTEYKFGFQGIIYSLGLFFLITLFPEKVILNIRNIDKYLIPQIKSKVNYNQSLRIKIAESANRITFETESLLNSFKTLYNSKRTLFSVLYVYYSDFYKLDDLPDKNEIFRIGVLGYVNPERRNYDLLLKSITKLKNISEVKIACSFLGKCRKEYASLIKKKFNQFEDVEIFTEYISDSNFLLHANKCNILIAPLSENTNMGAYGLSKSTSAFGDAISLNKKLVIPLFADKDLEFSSFTDYYTTTNELTNFLLNAVSEMNTSLSEKLFANYSTKNVIKKLIIDLELEE